MLGGYGDDDWWPPDTGSYSPLNPGDERYRLGDEEPLDAEVCWSENGTKIIYLLVSSLSFQILILFC